MQDSSNFKFPLPGCTDSPGCLPGSSGVSSLIDTGATMISPMLFLLAFLQLEAAPPPQPPLQAVQAGVVVLGAEVNAARRLDPPSVIYGAAPFVGPSVDSLRAWEFGPYTPAGENMSITFLYRSRTVLPDQPYEFDLETECCPGPDRPPLPTKIVDPGYPVNSVGEGAVVLHLWIDAAGRIEHVMVVRPEPSLTEAAYRAVWNWEFTPAIVNGRAVRSSAAVVVSFLRPVL